MQKLKIVLVGGGSFRWTPRLVCNILDEKIARPMLEALIAATRKWLPQF